MKFQIVGPHDLKKNKIMNKLKKLSEKELQAKEKKLASLLKNPSICTDEKNARIRKKIENDLFWIRRMGATFIDK